MFSRIKEIEGVRLAAKVLLGDKSSRERLRRLSVVFAVELRLKIVTELYMQEMSPTQFYREFGGGSPSRVAKNFSRLAEEGWLRHIRSAPSQSGRGREDFYRSTELAFFDDETWALLPYSMRVASSWNMFNQVAPRIRGAIETSSGKEHQGLTCASLMLDEVGWKHAIKAIEAQFVSLFEHQEDARLRVAHSGENLLRAEVSLLGFEAPLSHDGRDGPALAEVRKDPLISLSERLAPVLADEVCLQIVAELNKREMTVSQFHREFCEGRGDVNRRAVARRFEKLREICWLRIVGERPSRGAKERLYRAAVPAIEDNFVRPEILDSLDNADQWKAFEQLCGEAKDAMRMGTFDARTDRYIAWSLLSLDRQAWGQVNAELVALLARVHDEQERAKKRMASSGEKPIAMSVAVGAYEAPKDAVKAP